MKYGIMLGLCLLALAGCEKAPEEAKVEAVRVEAGKVILAEPDKAGFLKIGTVDRDQGGSLRLPGRLVWNEEKTVRVMPQLGGRVLRALVDVGATVKAGQGLAELSSADYGEARADARKADADWRLAQQALERAQALHEAGVIADKDWQQAQADGARAKAERERTAQRLSGLGGDGNGSYVLRSPLAGVVVDRNVNPGMEFRPDQGGQALFVVTDPTSLWLQLDASETDIALLKPGNSLALEVKQYPGQRFSGTIRHVADFVDPLSRTIKVRAEVPNLQRRLKGEMFVQGMVDLPPSDALRVPSGAVFLLGDKRYVFVEEQPGTYRLQAFEAAGERDGSFEVVHGLALGERVVLEGNLHLLKYIRPGANNASPVAK